MKRLFLGSIVIFTLVCFMGLMPSAAADKPKVVFGEEKHGIDDNAKPRDMRRGVNGIDGLNYSRENYTALEPSAGESYNQSATAIFYPGETIYLVDRYKIATPGSYARYRIITDVVGTTIAASATTFTATSTGFYYATGTISSLDLGSYFYQSIVVGPGEWILSQRFPFIVE